MPFREPVDWRGLGLYDYPQVISKPMDLLTVKQTIEKNGYKSINDCADDARFDGVRRFRERFGVRAFRAVAGRGTGPRSRRESGPTCAGARRRAAGGFWRRRRPRRDARARRLSNARRLDRWTRRSV